MNQFLVVLDSPLDSSIKVFDSATGQLLAATGSASENENGLGRPWSIAPASFPSSFWAFEIRARRVHLMEVADSGDRVRIRLRRSITLESPKIIFDVAQLPSGGFVAVGIFDDNRFAYFDANGRADSRGGDVPPAFKDAPTAVRQHAFQSRIALGPSPSPIASAFRHAGMLQLNTASGEHTRFAAVPVCHGIDYEVVLRSGHPSFKYGARLRFGYVDIAASSDFIFALYSGREMSAKPQNASAGSEVHVFDWAGRLLSVYEIDVDAIALDVDEEASRIYVVRQRPWTIMRYSITAAVAARGNVEPSRVSRLGIQRNAKTSH